MNIHEYQAKALLGDYGIPLPRGEVVLSTLAAEETARSLGGSRWVVKAQVPRRSAGQGGRSPHRRIAGRGRGGGGRAPG